MTRSAPLRGTEGVVVQIGRGSMRNEPRLFEVRGGDHWGQRIGSDVLERSKMLKLSGGVTETMECINMVIQFTRPISRWRNDEEVVLTSYRPNLGP